MKIICSVLIVCLVVFVSCGLQRREHDLASEKQFYILSVSPTEGSKITGETTISLNFSEPVWETTIARDSLFVITKSQYEVYTNQDWNDLYEAVTDGDVQIIESQMTIADDLRSVHLAINFDQIISDEYVVVALPKIQSQTYYPLNQAGLLSGSGLFSAHYLVVVNDDASLSENEVDPDANAPTSYPDVPTTYPESDDTEEESDQITETFDWNRVLITEVVTDPQQDHNDSEGGNGVLFDDEPGSGTVGSTDEYIEIFNGTEESLDVSKWSLNMIDGTDVLQTLDSTLWDTHSSLDDIPLEFLPGELVVFGNPDGAINNTLTLELLDEAGNVVDAVDIEDANADSTENEA